MKKTFFIAALILTFTLSVCALDIDSLDGAFRINKLTEDGYQTINNVNLVQQSDERGTISYEGTTEERNSRFNITFFHEDDGVYAIVEDGDFEAIYVVSDASDFHITLVNTDYPYDEMKLVYDKSGNDFDYDQYYSYLACLDERDLKRKLHDLIDNQKAVGYNSARVYIFRDLYNKDGYVEGVYTGKTLKTNNVPNSNIMNTEHTWPQSHFSGSEASTKKCDLHHLYPTDSKANSRRSSFDFGEVDSITWQEGGSYLGYNTNGHMIFEPRDEHKGNVARAIFYFSVRYNQSVNH
ncbi:MAG: hypothetical protein C0601_09870 [Candidatus Muiribacterium halophilum]|uniref:Endonuclease I n=1 Tax=Muiribacterium halophilum TaxID=2053465 RepID=A0A2N5ZD46_MUIH1|nr:MAG: hypothetical protein C0601_09870 [Candidatus Muirbacterium halophilum]